MRPLVNEFGCQTNLRRLFVFLSLSARAALCGFLLKDCLVSDSIFRSHPHFSHVQQAFANSSPLSYSSSKHTRQSSFDPPPQYSSQPSHSAPSTPWIQCVTLPPTYGTVSGQTAATRAIPHTPSWPAVPLPSTYPILHPSLDTISFPIS
ncbi:unnamed protein product, partial [Mycena citricolor]